MKTEERSRHTVWMDDAVWQRVQEHYKSEGCSTQNEFIAKAKYLGGLPRGFTDGHVAGSA